MKKTTLFTLFLILATICHAQTYFEGSLIARSYEEHSKMVLKNARGSLCNGARDAILHVKGKKLAVEDHKTNIYTIYNVEDDEMFLVFHNVKKAVKFSCTHFQKMTANNTVAPKQTNTYKTLTGHRCRLYTSEKNQKSGQQTMYARCDTYLSEDLAIDPALAPFASNTKLPFLGMKYVIKSNIKVGVVNVNSYTAYEVKEVIPCIVGDSLFAVPADYEIVDGTDRAKMLKVYDENLKIVKKSKKEKEKPIKEIKFDINEEWDF